MKNLLRIDSSLFAGQGVSSQLCDRLQTHLQDVHGALNITHRIFAEQPVPHLDAATLQAIMTPAGGRTQEQSDQVAFADQLIDEVVQADILLIAVPMYNFGIPSTLKAWFDFLARVGVTFKYTENGSVGLLTAKKIYLVTTRGGMHKDQGNDLQIPYVTKFLNFLGLEDIQVIYAEGLNMGDAVREKAIETARDMISGLEAG